LFNYCTQRQVTIGSEDLAASHSITQIVEVIEGDRRPNRLIELLEKYHKSKGCKNRCIIFVLYKKEAGQVEQFLQRKGWNAVAIHGDASQADRTAAVEKFKSGKVPLLIATDVAARGLDIPDVEVVMNYAFPLTVEDYVHRIGRTGRAGKTGISHTFFVGQNDKPRAGELVNVLREVREKSQNTCFPLFFRTFSDFCPSMLRLNFTWGCLVAILLFSFFFRTLLSPRGAGRG
jgi:ATP-dependent RNA helicase DBP3